MLPSATVVDSAITALVAAVRAALPGVQVLDGPTAESPEQDVVVIGMGEPAAVTDRSEPDFGGRVTETGDIVCVVSCWDGEGRFSAVRARMVELVGGIDLMLRDDPTLGGAVDDAYLGETGEMQQVMSNGAVCALGFSVRYEAHI